MNTNPDIQKTKFFQFLRQRACEKQKLKKFCFLDIWRRYQSRRRSRLFQGFGAYIVWFWHFKTNFKFFGYFIHLALFSNFSKILEDFWQILEDFLHFWYFFFTILIDFYINWWFGHFTYISQIFLSFLEDFLQI